MAREGRASRAVMASATPLPQAAGTTLYWDGRSGVCHEVRPQTGSESGERSSFRAMGQAAIGDGARPYWTTSAISIVPFLSPQAMAWGQEAAHLTFDLGLQVGWAEQSHFTAFFRTHVSMPPKAFRDHARRA